MMAEGETRQIWVEMDFWDRHMYRDFSVVVWGREGELTLEHEAGFESTDFEMLPPDDNPIFDDEEVQEEL